MARLTGIKVIANGHVIEVYEYERPAWFDFEGRGGRRREDEPESERAAEYRWRTCRKARGMIRRLCLANFDNHSKFVTLTFAENMTDIDKANRLFKQFIQRMRYRYGSFKYVAVIEFQDRGAVHYHMMSDLPYIPKDELAAIWRHGFVRINDISSVDNVGAYMVKYMMKDVHDVRLKGRKAYLTSRGLEKPVELRGDEALQVVGMYDLENRKKVFATEYESEHNGIIRYSEYNLKREKK